SRIVLALALCGVVCCTPPPLVAGPLPVASTVLDAPTAPDGARVQLNGVSVAFTGPDASVLVVFDPWSRDLRLPVLTSGYVDVANGQTVAVTGSMTTLRGGLRAVAKPEIRPYLDSAGRPIPFPLPPAMAAELPAWRVG